jgi:hypothetical protein
MRAVRHGELLNDQLAVINYDVHNRRSSFGNSPRIAEASLEASRQQMKQQKYGSTDAETKLWLFQACRDDLMSSGFADSSLLQERRKEAKQQNKKLKAVLRQEEEAQGRLQDSLKEAFQEAHSVADACQRELEELHMIQRDMSEIGGDVSCTLGDDTSGSLPTGMNNHVPEEPQKGFKMLERMRSLHKAENDKRLDLEEQQERLEALLKRKQAQSVASQDKHDKERKLVGHMEQLNRLCLVSVSRR